MRWLAIVLLLPLLACSHSPSAPTPVPVPVPTPTPAPIVQPDPAQFDATFNAQFVHNALEASPVRAQLLHANPAIYLQTAGLDPAMPAQLETEARAIVPMLSGGMLSVVAFESGPDLRPDAGGWIIVQPVTHGSLQNPQACGQSLEATAAGHIWLEVDPAYRDMNA